MNRGKRIALLLAVGLPVLIGGLAWLITTDREAIERLTDEVREAFLAGDADAAVARLAPGATIGGRLPEGPLEPVVRRYVSLAAERAAKIGLNLRRIEVDEDRAEAVWMVVVTLRDDDGPPLVRLDLRIRYAREADGWRIAHLSVE